MKAAAALMLLALAACVQAPTPPADAPVASASPVPSDSQSPDARPVAPATSAPASPPAVVEVPLRIERLTSDAATRGAAAEIMRILTHRRGWVRAGYRFTPEKDGNAVARVVLAEGDDVDELCRPYDTYGLYSCQNGPTVALNADRWRTATPSWPGSLSAYRTMLVNHEVGHLLHLHHPRPQCPGAGLPAPIMAQQSTELGECAANPWPLRWEVRLAAQRREPFAPPASHDTSDHRPSPPPARS